MIKSYEKDKFLINQKKQLKKKLLVTGGTGYIGSHTIVQLLESNNYEVIAIDNFSNSSLEVAQRVKSITGKSFELIEGDIREKKNPRKHFFK